MFNKIRTSLFLTLIFLFTITTINSSNYDESLYEDIPQYCIVERTEAGAYEEWKSNTSFNTVVTNLTKELLETNFSTTQSYTYRDFGEGIDLEINFLGRDETSSTRYGVYYNSTKSIDIYTGNIYDVYSDRFNNESLIYDKIVNTLKHEIFHYYDLHFNGFGSRETKTQIFNTSYNQTSFNLNNQEYYETITGETAESLIYQYKEVPPHLRNSVDFAFVFDDYDLDSHENEVVARISALCLREVSNQNFRFNVSPTLEQYKFCEEFSFRSEDSNKYQDIIDEISEKYFYDNFPQYELEPLVLSNDQCETYSSTVKSIKLQRAFFDIMSVIMDNLVTIMISLTSLLIIGIFLRFGVFDIIGRVIKTFK